MWGWYIWECVQGVVDPWAEGGGNEKTSHPRKRGGYYTLVILEDLLLVKKCWYYALNLGVLNLSWLSNFSYMPWFRIIWWCISCKLDTTLGTICWKMYGVLVLRHFRSFYETKKGGGCSLIQWPCGGEAVREPTCISNGVHNWDGVFVLFPTAPPLLRLWIVPDKQRQGLRKSLPIPWYYKLLAWSPIVHCCRLRYWVKSVIRILSSFME